MNLSSLTSADLKQIAKLLERRERLLSEISNINTELDGYAVSMTGQPALSSSRYRFGVVPAIQGGRAKRGELKDTILEILKTAGKSGVSLQEISARAGVKPMNVSAWFAATGKKFPEIQKAGRGIYRWNS
jgi:hypothetical protein